MARANFFWHGSALSLYERACLASFVRSGFDVRLFAFDSALEVPAGVRLADAGVLARAEETREYTQGGRPESITSFSNIFRYRLLGEEGGWWFDADVFCLADSSAFEALASQSRGLLGGRESENSIGTAVLYASDPSVGRELEVLAAAKGKVLPWGAIGPVLVTEFARIHPERVTAVPVPAFYPIPWTEFRRLHDPDWGAYCLERASSSLCVHLWNNLFRSVGLPRDLLPCAGSYLASLFSPFEAEAAGPARLPQSLLRTIFAYEDLKREYDKLAGRFGPLLRAVDRVFPEGSLRRRLVRRLRAMTRRH